MTKRKKPIWHPIHWPLQVGLFLLKLFALLPYSFKYWLGKIIGLSLYQFHKPMRRIAEINILHVFPEKTTEQRSKIIKKSFINLGRSFTDVVSLIWMRSESEFDNFIHSIKGENYIYDALNNKQGVLLLFPHVTSIYMVGFLLLRKMNIPFSIMYHSPKNPVLKKLGQDTLDKYCEHAFNRKNLKPLMSHLKQGGLVWYAPDLEPGKRNRAVFVPFFGIEAATHTSTAKIAKASGAKAVPIGFYRRKDKTFDIRFYPPLENFPCDDPIIDATNINQTMETIIRKHPGQYLWQYKRFSKSPTGKTSIYDK